MFIGLPLTDAGIPETATERIRVVDTLMAHASPFGYTADDIVVDGLVMTISSSPGAARETLEMLSKLELPPSPDGEVTSEPRRS